MDKEIKKEFDPSKYGFTNIMTTRMGGRGVSPKHSCYMIRTNHGGPMRHPQIRIIIPDEVAAEAIDMFGESVGLANDAGGRVAVFKGDHVLIRRGKGGSSAQIAATKFGNAYCEQVGSFRKLYFRPRFDYEMGYLELIPTGERE